MTPITAAHRNQLTPTQRLVLDFLEEKTVDRRNRTPYGYCIHRIATIARKVGCCRRTVELALARLRELGLVAVVKGSKLRELADRMGWRNLRQAIRLLWRPAGRRDEARETPLFPPAGPGPDTPATPRGIDPCASGDAQILRICERAKSSVLKIPPLEPPLEEPKSDRKIGDGESGTPPPVTPQVPDPIPDGADPIPLVPVPPPAELAEALALVRPHYPADSVSEARVAEAVREFGIARFPGAIRDVAAKVARGRTLNWAYFRSILGRGPDEPARRAPKPSAVANLPAVPLPVGSLRVSNALRDLKTYGVAPVLDPEGPVRWEGLPGRPGFQGLVADLVAGLDGEAGAGPGRAASPSGGGKRPRSPCLRPQRMSRPLPPAPRRPMACPWRHCWSPPRSE